MTRKKVIELLLQKYSFSKDEKKILLMLCERSASAPEILANTTVSSGRIYKILGKLEEIGVVVREGVKPSIYSMEPFQDCINKFLEFKLKEETQSQGDILNLISKIDRSANAEVIQDTKKRFDMEIINMNTSCAWLKLIHKDGGIPWFLYAFFPEESFFKVRNHMVRQRVIGSSAVEFDLLQKRRSYLELYEKADVEHIMQTKDLDKYTKDLEEIFGKDTPDYIKQINKNLKSHSKVKIYLVEHMISPFSVYIYDKEVIMPIFTNRNQNRMVRMSGNEFVDIYLDYFLSFRKTAQKIMGL
ncbi:hypothetical protein JXA34_04025 [Patescibacteria group bacterium]|nr:hypothetical protein [Patescibacteria group bacterium]